MGSGGKSSPKQQDIAPAINAQAATNYMNQFTPYGNITYGGQKKISLPGQPDAFVPASMNMTLSQPQQRLQDQRDYAQQRMADLGIGLAGQFPSAPAAQYQGYGDYHPVYSTTGQVYNPSYVNAAPAYNPTYYQDRPDIQTQDFAAHNFQPGDFEAARGAAERAVFDRSMSLMRPELQREEESLRQRLANQGLPQASGAFNKEMGRFETSRAEQMDRLAQSAVLQGLQAQQQGYGQARETFGANAEQAIQAHAMNQANRLAANQMNVQEGLAGYGLNAQQAQFGHQMNQAERQWAQNQNVQQSLYRHQAGQADRQWSYGANAQQAQFAQQQNAAQRLATAQMQMQQRAQQQQEMLGMFGLQGVQLPQAQQMPQIDIPWQQGGGGGGGMGMQGPMQGALMGAGAGAPFGPWGAGIGAGLGGLMGLGMM